MPIQTSSITTETDGNLALDPSGSGKVQLPDLAGSGQDPVAVDNDGSVKSLNLFELPLEEDLADGDAVMMQLQNGDYVRVDPRNFTGPGVADPQPPEDIVWIPSTPPGSGTINDPYILTAVTSFEIGGSVQSVESIQIINQTPGSTVPFTELNGDIGRRMDQQSKTIGASGETSTFKFDYIDAPATESGRDYKGLIQIGASSIYVEWTVSQIANNTSFGPVSAPNASPASVSYAGDNKYGTVTATWAGGSTTLTASSMVFSVNGGVLDSSSKAIVDDDTIAIAFVDAEVAAAVDGATITGTLTSSEGSYFKEIQLVKDSSPAPPSFQSLSNTAPSTAVSTNTVYLTGFNAPAIASATGTSANPLTSATVSIDGGSPVASGTIIPGQTLQGFGTTGSANSTAYQATFSVGGASSIWQATTVAASPVIVTPQITSPAYGSENLSPVVTVSGSAYSALNGAGAHTSSTWEVYQANPDIKFGLSSFITSATPGANNEVTLITVDNTDYGLFGGGVAVVQDTPLFLSLGTVTGLTLDEYLFPSDHIPTFPGITPYCGGTPQPSSGTTVTDPYRSFDQAWREEFLNDSSVILASYTGWGYSGNGVQCSRQYLLGSDSIPREDISRLEILMTSRKAGGSDCFGGIYQVIRNGQTERTCDDLSIPIYCGKNNWADVTNILGTDDFNGWWQFANHSYGASDTITMGVPYTKIWPSNKEQEPYYLNNALKLQLSSATDIAALTEGQAVYHTNEFANGNYYNVRNTPPANVGPDYANVDLNAIIGWNECTTEIQEVTQQSVIRRTIPEVAIPTEEQSNVILVDFRFPTKFVYTKFFQSTGTTASIGLFGSATGVRGSWTPIAQAIGVDPSVNSFQAYRYYAIVRFDNETARQLIGIDPAYDFQTAANGRVTQVDVAQNFILVQPLLGEWIQSNVVGAQMFGGTALQATGTVKTADPSTNTIVIENSNGYWVADGTRKVKTISSTTSAPGAPDTNPPDASKYTSVSPSAEALTTATLNGSNLNPNKFYYSRVKYADNGAVVSDFSNYNEFGTSSAFTYSLGQPLSGGYFGGQIEISGVLYNLIIAPVTSGSLNGQFGGVSAATSAWVSQNAPMPTFAADNLYYGKTVTDAFGSNPDYPILHFAASDINGPNAGQTSGGTGIGGFNDWYIPSLYEAEILYYNLKPATTLNYAQSGGNPYSVPSRANQLYTSIVSGQTPLVDWQADGPLALPPSMWTSSSPGGDLVNYLSSRLRYGSIGTDTQYTARAIRREAA